MNKAYEVTDVEHEEVTGAGVRTDWFPTITNDCPNSVVVCC